MFKRLISINIYLLKIAFYNISVEKPIHYYFILTYYLMVLLNLSFFKALLTDSFIIFSFLAQNKLCFIQFTKKMCSPDINKRLEKLSALDYKVEISI